MYTQEEGGSGLYIYDSNTYVQHIPKEGGGLWCTRHRGVCVQQSWVGVSTVGLVNNVGVAVGVQVAGVQGRE